MWRLGHRRQPGLNPSPVLAIQIGLARATSEVERQRVAPLFDSHIPLRFSEFETVVARERGGLAL